MPFWTTPGLMPMAGPLDTVTVRSRTGDWTPDPEGRPVESTTEYQLVGRLTQLSAVELSNLGQFAENVTAVFLTSLSSTISDKDQVIATGVDPRLDGIYEITAVRYTPAHLRCLLRLVR